jgi:hypothetical protein
MEKALMCPSREWTACLVGCQDHHLCELVRTARAVRQECCSVRGIDLLPPLAHQYLLWCCVSLMAWPDVRRLSPRLRGQLSWRSTLRTTSSWGTSENECVLLRVGTLWLDSDGAADPDSFEVDERLGL